MEGLWSLLSNRASITTVHRALNLSPCTVAKQDQVAVFVSCCGGTQVGSSLHPGRRL